MGGSAFLPSGLPRLLLGFRVSLLGSDNVKPSLSQEFCDRHGPV